jgi:hypothetical protein
MKDSTQFKSNLFECPIQDQAIYRVKTLEPVRGTACRHVRYLLMSQYIHAVSLLNMAELIEET